MATKAVKPMTPLEAVEIIRSTFGAAAAISRSLGVSHPSIVDVMRGRKTSARILAAIMEHAAVIEATKASSAKTRIPLQRCA